MKFAGADLDLDLELSVKPVIQELVRTQVCFPNLKLLVDRIAVVTVPDVDELSGNEAFKLTLTDGEKTIQALLKRRIYKTIYNEDVAEGSYVILKVYHLAKGERVRGKGTITRVYIIIEDFYSIGEDDRYNPILEPIEEASHRTVDADDSVCGGPGLGSAKALTAYETQNAPGDKAVADPASRRPPYEQDVENESQPSSQHEKYAAPTPPSSQQLREAMKRKWDTALDEIDTNDTYRLSKYRKLEEARAQEAKAAAEASAKALLIKYQSLPTTPLIAITGLNKRRNTHHDVLALIISVSPETVKRASMPPKRDLQIMDTSTIKKVSLSVFINAESFKPEPGTVALFKNLTTHDYDGGSLNAYAKDCEGRDWCIPDPPGFANGEVAQLKDCWARLQFSEQVAREQSDSLSQSNEPLDIPEEDDIADRLPTVSGKKHLTCFYWAKNGSCRYSGEECAYAHYNTGIVANDPMRNHQSVPVSANNSNNNNNGEANTNNNNDVTEERSGLPPSRSLTCFFWARNRKCKRSDEECSYAHYDTGTVARAPPGVTIFDEPEETLNQQPPLTKTLTCYFWHKNGKCSRSEEACAYAHHDTGTVAYPPPTVVASPAASSSSNPGARILTCFFWATYGRCKRQDGGCTYAHYDTGIVANNPNPAVFPEPFQTAATPLSISIGNGRARSGINGHQYTTFLNDHSGNGNDFLNRDQYTNSLNNSSTNNIPTNNLTHHPHPHSHNNNPFTNNFFSNHPPQYIRCTHHRR
ncbi:MAG: hypothetical protein L6R39_005893 [Caloplaca ligustica]|nr:MAG: hypothetical protein L6R39_005893 [Caloplaca ligustica]